MCLLCTNTLTLPFVDPNTMGDIGLFSAVIDKQWVSHICNAHTRHKVELKAAMQGYTIPVNTSFVNISLPFSSFLLELLPLGEALLEVASLTGFLSFDLSLRLLPLLPPLLSPTLLRERLEWDSNSLERDLSPTKERNK